MTYSKKHWYCIHTLRASLPLNASNDKKAQSFDRLTLVYHQPYTRMR